MEASVLESLSNPLKKAKELASEKGASSWLTALPIADHGFCLHKGAFRDALCLRYNWSPPFLPSSCVCGSSFQVDHALSCHRGGFPSIRHNELRDLTAHLLTEVCSNVGVEPALQPLGSERMDYRSANTEDSARLDIKADNFWNRDKVPSLTYVFLTHLPHLIGIIRLPPVTDKMNKRRDAHMMREYAK